VQDLGRYSVVMIVLTSLAISCGVSGSSPRDCPTPSLDNAQETIRDGARTLIRDYPSASGYVRQQRDRAGWPQATANKVIDKLKEITELARALLQDARSLDVKQLDARVLRINQIWADVVHLSAHMFEKATRGDPDRRQLGREFRHRLNPSSRFSRAIYDQLSVLHPACQ
jgi:hypothetical protein